MTRPLVKKGTLVKNYSVNSIQETAAVAKTFALQLSQNDTVAFYGDLGSGKTLFIKQLCKTLETLEKPTSPTFTIINEYQLHSGKYIYHFDFYRIDHPAELINLGLDEYFYSENLCLIEWADKIQEDLPLPRFNIFINFVENNHLAREISIYRLEQIL